jgi:predicted ATPase
MMVGIGASVSARSLVDRREKLALLDAALAAARSAAGSVLLFEGPAGIGKTSLLAAAAERGA